MIICMFYMKFTLFTTGGCFRGRVMSTEVIWYDLVHLEHPPWQQRGVKTTRVIPKAGTIGTF